MNTLRTLILLLVASLACSATTIVLTGAPTGAVGPYDLTVGGVATTGVCVTYDIEIGVGYSWTANLDQVTDFSNPVQQQYLQAEWLEQQFATNSDWNGIHDAIWDIFEPGTFGGTDVSNWITLSFNNFASVDKNSFLIAVPVPTDASQTFLIPETVGITTATPEPSGLWMVLGGIVLIAGTKIWQKLHKKTNCEC